jgi:N-acetylglutamate synthase-like GNAT family acetyltransferase
MNALPPREVTVRRASANDAQAIAALLADSFAEYQALYTPEGFAATVISSLQVAKRINERPVWVAISENVVVGTISVVRKEDSLYVRSLALHPAVRARSVGQNLHTEIEKYAAANAVHRLFLSTTPFLDRAIRLYEKFG